MSIKMKSAVQVFGLHIVAESNVLGAWNWTINRGLENNPARSPLLLTFTESVSCTDVTAYIVKHRHKKEYQEFNVFECHPTATKRKAKRGS